MKTTLTLSVVAAFVAVACGAPVPFERDWDTALTWNTEFGRAVSNLVIAINTTALNENILVGLRISRGLEDPLEFSLKTFLQNLKGIEEKTLIADEARIKLYNAIASFNAFMRNHKNLIQKLSPLAQDTILKTHVSAIADMSKATSKILVALQGEFARAERLVKEIRIIFNFATAKIIHRASTASSTIGRQIAENLNEAWGKNSAILTKVESDISDQTLESGQLTSYMKDMFENLWIVEDKIWPLLDRLPKDAQLYITNDAEEATDIISSSVRELCEVLSIDYSLMFKTDNITALTIK